jgi:hypothetical protein
VERERREAEARAAERIKQQARERVEREARAAERIREEAYARAAEQARLLAAEASSSELYKTPSHDLDAYEPTPYDSAVYLPTPHNPMPAIAASPAPPLRRAPLYDSNRYPDEPEAAEAEAEDKSKDDEAVDTIAIRARRDPFGPPTSRQAIIDLSARKRPRSPYSS